MENGEKENVMKRYRNWNYLWDWQLAEHGDRDGIASSGTFKKIDFPTFFLENNCLPSLRNSRTKK